MKRNEIAACAALVVVALAAGFGSAGCGDNPPEASTPTATSPGTPAPNQQPTEPGKPVVGNGAMQVKPMNAPPP